MSTEVWRVAGQPVDSLACRWPRPCAWPSHVGHRDPHHHLHTCRQCQRVGTAAAPRVEADVGVQTGSVPGQADLPVAELQWVPRAGDLDVCERVSSAARLV